MCPGPMSYIEIRQSQSSYALTRNYYNMDKISLLSTQYCESVYNEILPLSSSLCYTIEA
jgi:hypothetical protein